MNTKKKFNEAIASFCISSGTFAIALLFMCSGLKTLDGPLIFSAACLLLLAGQLMLHARNLHRQATTDASAFQEQGELITFIEDPMPDMKPLEHRVAGLPGVFFVMQIAHRQLGAAVAGYNFDGDLICVHTQ